MHPTEPHDDPSTVTPKEGAAFVLLAAAAGAGAVLTDHAGSLLPFFAALLVAGMAWISADRRQGRQITAQREALTAQLEAERERHAAGLAHARELADVDDLRDLLDEAAVALHVAKYAASAARQKHTQLGASVGLKAARLIRQAWEAGRDLDAMAARLAVRLGPGDRLALTFAEANRWLLVFMRSIEMSGLDDELNRGWSRVQSLNEAFKGFDGYVRDFESVAAARVGARMDASSDPPASPDLVPPPADAMPVLQPHPDD
ncbi:hypothetical protein FSW04_18910 [Baekduia soli]|uniref:Uncharacterized protein n=1 Tax=Baekduia soli TaxID=496014 RepID=A0A5B8U8J3_9ACTN|nr:hypothetical protein [Baekduia soli]QEC49436.1 hypothetical protein FSW04_18910 [Baekduia soli]